MKGRTLESAVWEACVLGVEELILGELATVAGQAGSTQKDQGDQEEPVMWEVVRTWESSEQSPSHVTPSRVSRCI